MTTKPPSFGNLLDVVKDMAKKVQIWDEAGEMQRDLPKKWEKHGDMIILPHDCFTLKQWRLLGPDLWRGVAAALQATRVGRKRQLVDDPYRTPLIELKYGKDGWVQHEHKGITYEYDVTRCTFRIGDMSEKQRMGEMLCQQEVVVDLFAGLGYYTLAFLMHANARHVYSVDWDDDAIEALRRNVVFNHVADKCTIIQGDVRKFAPSCVADRVNAPLLPTSKPQWLTVCKCLKAEGGFLHLHMTAPSEKSSTPRRGSLVKQDSDAVNLDRKNQSDLRRVVKGATPKNVFKRQPSKDVSDLNSPKSTATPTQNAHFEFPAKDTTDLQERTLMSKTERADSGFSANLSETTTTSDGLDDSADEIVKDEPKKLSRRERGLQSRAASIVEEMLSRRQAPALICSNLIETGTWEKYNTVYKNICFDAADSCTKYMNNLHEIDGHTFVTTILRCGKVKQYTPDLDHLVIDLQVKCVKSDMVEFGD